MIKPLNIRGLDRVREAICQFGPLAAFERLMAESNELILQPTLDIGRELAESRCAIYFGMMEHWADQQKRDFGYDQPFAVVALGGTGRKEMTPCSDQDFAFLFDDSIEGNQFLKELQRQTLHTDEFFGQYGFNGVALPFNLDDMPDLEEKQLNAFVDMFPIYDPDGLTGRFRERIRSSYDPFEHFLHVSRFWRENWGELDSKNEQLDCFNVKADGLRVFLAGIWTLAGKQFQHSHDIYESLEDPRDLEAYYFLLRIRSFVHLRKGTVSAPSASGAHAEDVLDFDDFLGFGELAGTNADERTQFEFANEVRSRFLTARRRVDRFTWGVIGRELQEGRVIRKHSAIVYGTGGLRDTATDRETDWDKSRAALAVVVASQRYGIPIDPFALDTNFRGAGDWLIPVPEVSDLFYESRGSLADSFKFLGQLPGAEDKLFKGYSKFESSIDERLMVEQKCLRGALVREKLRCLEIDLEEGRRLLNEAINPQELAEADFEISRPVEAALLDEDHLAAVRLAIKTKRLPETDYDVAAREDTSLPLHERYSSGFSGIPLSEYYQLAFKNCGFPDETLQLARFLIKNRKAFKESAATDLMDEHQVEKILSCCLHDESLLRALFVYTCADRSNWESEVSDPARWFKIRELYAKARMSFQSSENSGDQLASYGFSRDQIDILRGFGDNFFAGIYRQYAVRFGSYLFGLVESKQEASADEDHKPKINRIRIGTSEILGIATLDHPGIAASISGAFWKFGVGLSQAHLFSAEKYGVALDFFHLLPPESEGESFDFQLLTTEISSAISERRYISEADEADIPGVAKNISLRKTASGLYQLRAETETDVGALIYLLTCKAYRRLDANIHGLAAHTDVDNARVSVYLSLPQNLNREQAAEIVSGW